MLEKKLLKLIFQNYTKDDFPCLLDQSIRFKKNKPFRGLRILSATPIFKNYYAKILPLISGGADLVITSPKFIKSSEEVIEKLISIGVEYNEKINGNQKFDFILDCGAEHLHVSSLGYVELTKSGESKYVRSGKRFINVDSSNCKIIEDRYGTSDGFIRAMKKAGYSDLKGLKALLIGYGKVGSGVGDEIINRGGEIKFFDPNIKDFSPKKILSPEEIISFSPDIVITATGVESAVEKSGLVPILKKSNAVLVNLGVEDEYGKLFDKTEVLNSKMPLNFILPEPTKLRFLDPTFALQNECLIELIFNRDILNSVKPPKHLDDSMCEIFFRNNK